MMFETLEDLEKALAYKVSEQELRQTKNIVIDRAVFIEIYDCIKRNCKP